MGKVSVTTHTRDSSLGEGLVELVTGGLLKASQSTTYDVSSGGKTVTFDNKSDALTYASKIK